MNDPLVPYSVGIGGSDGLCNLGEIVTTLRLRVPMPSPAYPPRQTRLYPLRQNLRHLLRLAVAVAAVLCRPPGLVAVSCRPPGLVAVWRRPPGLGLAFALGWLMVMPHALAVEPNEMLANPVLEAQARSLSQELRCLVCRNQSIDDSDADLARDLRVLVRQRLQQGASPEVIKAEIVARYGDYVLLSPPFNWRSWLLWLSPFLVFGLALVLGFFALRWRREVIEEPQALTLSEKVRLEGLLRRHDREQRQPRTPPPPR
ncbi:MAG: cytochrome c-type biogenesis protein CcmH [Candidatus Symbiobacter sp.]|nr:cytochrome c-type biogenesis protein CcmH [Candidatus Symbiobacter sp.]